MLTAEKMLQILNDFTSASEDSDTGLVTDYWAAMHKVSQEAREQALEDAAKVCEEKDISAHENDFDVGYDRAVNDCAKDIRALKEQVK